MFKHLSMVSCSVLFGIGLLVQPAVASASTISSLGDSPSLLSSIEPIHIERTLAFVAVPTAVVPEKSTLDSAKVWPALLVVLAAAALVRFVAFRHDH